jgi:hypothetical protein
MYVLNEGVESGKPPRFTRPLANRHFASELTPRRVFGIRARKTPRHMLFDSEPQVRGHFIAEIILRFR